MQEKKDFLYRGTPHVKENSLKFSRSYKIKKFLRGLLVLGIIIVAAFVTTVICLNYLYPFANVNGKYQKFEKEREYSKESILIVEPNPQWHDQVFYLLKLKSASVYKVNEMPLNIVKVKNGIYELKADEYFLDCVENCNTKDGPYIVPIKNIKGKVVNESKTKMLDDSKTEEPKSEAIDEIPSF